MYSDLSNRWLNEYSPGTREAYERDFQQFVGFCVARSIDPYEATRSDITEWRLSLAGRSPATIKRKLSAVASFFKFACQEGEIEKNPTTNVRRPKVDQDSTSTGLTKGESNALLNEARRDGPEALALVSVLLYTGLRISEALSLRWSDIRSERGHTVADVTRKRGKTQVVPLPLPVVQSLQRVEAEDLIFTFDRTTAWRIITRLAKRAGLPHIGPHSLRHTFVTLALESGAPLQDVQDAAGHADPRTTQRYNRSRNRLDNNPTYRLAGFLQE